MSDHRVTVDELCEHGVLYSHNAIRLPDGRVIGDEPCPGGSRRVLVEGEYVLIETPRPELSRLWMI